MSKFQFSISVGGKKIDLASRIISMNIKKKLNSISGATIILNNKQQQGSDADKDLIPGKKISIECKDNDGLRLLFEGMITGCSIKNSDGANLESHIECHDEAIQMTRVKNNGLYSNIKDSELFDQLTANYPTLKAAVDETQLRHKEMVRYNISDWDFISLRAAANGMVMLTDNNTIKIFQPDTNSAPVHALTWGNNFLEINATLDALQQYSTVQSRSWDYHQQNILTTTADDVPFNESGNISSATLSTAMGSAECLVQHGGDRQHAELQEWTSAVLLRSRLSKITGRAKITGISSIKPGDLVSLTGLGSQFDGNVFVSSVTHEISDGTMSTSIKFGLKVDKWMRIEDDQRAGDILVGSIHGLQIGKVLQLENDPANEYRILVDIPIIDNHGQGVWARIQSPDAGANRGFFFLPEIGDEVVVGFINNDSRDPVVLGCLYSSSKPAPITAKDDNHEKAIVTRSKLRISLNDDTKTIFIDTPAGNKIVLDENNNSVLIGDQHNNKIEMGPQGINVSGNSNIDITAGTVKVNGKII